MLSAALCAAILVKYVDVWVIFVVNWVANLIADVFYLINWVADLIADVFYPVDWVADPNIDAFYPINAAFVSSISRADKKMGGKKMALPIYQEMRWPIPG
jgi:hypothetical protein